VLSRPITQTIYSYSFILCGILTIIDAVDSNNIRVCRLDPEHTQQEDNQGGSSVGEHHCCLLKAGAQENQLSLGSPDQQHQINEEWRGLSLKK
jgi:hypothetical protein